MSKKHGARRKRRKRHPPLPPGAIRPRKALLAALAELGITEADLRRIGKARAIADGVSDELAARGSPVRYIVSQVVVHDKPERPSGLSADEF